jgi:hypothetical protein
MVEVSKSRGREVPGMGKSFYSIEFYQVYAAQKMARPKREKTPQRLDDESPCSAYKLRPFRV